MQERPQLIIKPRLSLPAKSQYSTMPMATIKMLKVYEQPSKRQVKQVREKRHRYIIFKIVCQCLYAIIAVILAIVVYSALAEQPVYRVVTLVIIGILWSTAAGSMAFRKPVNLQETALLPALPPEGYTNETYAYLKAIKKSLLEH